MYLLGKQNSMKSSQGIWYRSLSKWIRPPPPHTHTHPPPSPPPTTPTHTPLFSKGFITNMFLQCGWIRPPPTHTHTLPPPPPPPTPTHTPLFSKGFITNMFLQCGWGIYQDFANLKVKLPSIPLPCWGGGFKWLVHKQLINTLSPPMLVHILSPETDNCPSWKFLMKECACFYVEK